MVYHFGILRHFVEDFVGLLITKSTLCTSFHKQYPIWKEAIRIGIGKLSNYGGNPKWSWWHIYQRKSQCEVTSEIRIHHLWCHTMFYNMFHRISPYFRFIMRVRVFKVFCGLICIVIIVHCCFFFRVPIFHLTPPPLSLVRWRYSPLMQIHYLSHKRFSSELRMILTLRFVCNGCVDTI